MVSCGTPRFRLPLCDLVLSIPEVMTSRVAMRSVGKPCRPSERPQPGTTTRMEFDRYTISLLLLRPDAPELDVEAETELQNAHMRYLADLHEAGQLLAAGPVLGGSELRGFSIMNVDPEQARQLKEQDPAVRAGKYRIEVYPWILPGGLMEFSHGRLPRSMAEATGS